MVGQNPQPVEPEIHEDLAADAEITPVHGLGLDGNAVVSRQVGPVDVVTGRTSDPLKPAAEIVAGAFGSKIDDRASPRLTDHLQ